MITATVTAVFQADIQRVWAVVTDNRHIDWRSDLNRVECSPDGCCFTEYTREGFPTNFTITCLQPFERYAFDLQNQNLSGSWTGLFRETAAGTEVKFIEKIQVKNPMMALLARGYLKKQQRRYIADLRKVLGE